MEALERKIIKMGECCEVYSEKRAPHPLKEILSQSISDDVRRETETRDLKKEEK
jgi:hypothetical protein